MLTGPGGFIITSRVSSPELMKSRLAEEANQALATQLGNPVEFTAPDGGMMLGTLQQVPRLSGNVVASLPLSEAFQQVTRLRNMTILMVVGLLVVVGGLAYILSLVIIRPLERLREGAAKVAAGDLDVNLPVTGGGEVSYLTEIFNDMVRRLRESRQELERISITDSLTGLVNRRRLMEALSTEVERANRKQHPCTVLMVDVDHFKQFNDTYGHPAGDAVLTRVAAILRESIRTIDVAGRYGGEEFLLLLTETTMTGGAGSRRADSQQADRRGIRRRAHHGQCGCRGVSRRGSQRRGTYHECRPGAVSGEEGGSRPGGAGSRRGGAGAVLTTCRLCAGSQCWKRSSLNGRSGLSPAPSPLRRNSR